MPHYDGIVKFVGYQSNDPPALHIAKFLSQAGTFFNCCTVQAMPPLFGSLPGRLKQSAIEVCRHPIHVGPVRIVVRNATAILLQSHDLARVEFSPHEYTRLNFNA